MKKGNVLVISIFWPLFKNFWENMRDSILRMFEPYASLTVWSIMSTSKFCSTIYYFEFNYVRINCKEGEASFRIKLLSTVINIFWTVCRCRTFNDFIRLRTRIKLLSTMIWTIHYKFFEMKHVAFLQNSCPFMSMHLSFYWSVLKQVLQVTKLTKANIVTS